MTTINHNYFYGRDGESTKIVPPPKSADALKIQTQPKKPKCHICKKKHTGRCRKAIKGGQYPQKKKCSTCYKYHKGGCWWLPRELEPREDLRSTILERQREKETETLSETMEEMVISPIPQ